MIRRSELTSDGPGVKVLRIRRSSAAFLIIMEAFIFFVSCVLYLHCVFDMIIRRYPRCRIGYLGGGGGAYWNGSSTRNAKRRNTRPRQDKGNYWLLSKVLLPFLTPTHLYRSRLLYLERIYRYRL
jgi:hypothetical protein